MSICCLALPKINPKSNSHWPLALSSTCPNYGKLNASITNHTSLSKLLWTDTWYDCPFPGCKSTLPPLSLSSEIRQCIPLQLIHIVRRKWFPQTCKDNGGELALKNHGSLDLLPALFSCFFSSGSLSSSHLSREPFLCRGEVIPSLLYHWCAVCYFQL